MPKTSRVRDAENVAPIEDQWPKKPHSKAKSKGQAKMRNQ